MKKNKLLALLISTIFLFQNIDCTTNRNNQIISESDSSIADFSNDTSYSSSEKYFSNIDWKDYDKIYAINKYIDVEQILGIKMKKNGSIDFKIYIDNKVCKSEYQGVAKAIKEKASIKIGKKESLKAKKYSYKTDEFEIVLFFASEKGGYAFVEFKSDSMVNECDIAKEVMKLKKSKSAKK
jgi:hypothetical protein